MVQKCTLICLGYVFLFVCFLYIDLIYLCMGVKTLISITGQLQSIYIRSQKVTRKKYNTFEKALGDGVTTTSNKASGEV